MPYIRTLIVLLAALALHGPAFAKVARIEIDSVEPVR